MSACLESAWADGVEGDGNVFWLQVFMGYHHHEHLPCGLAGSAFVMGCSLGSWLTWRSCTVRERVKVVNYV
jgi:hypothetical protein